VEQNAAQAMGQTCFLIRVNLLHELLIRFNELDQLRKNDSATFQALSQALQLIIFDEIQRAHSLAANSVAK
jgi:predicted AAA+ superfamily ATPase